MNIAGSIPLFGSLVNGITIIVGGFVGYALRSKLPKHVMKLPEQLLGAVALTLGVSMTLKTQNMLILVFSTAVGAIVGGLMDIQGRTERAVERLEKHIQKSGSGFSQAFLSSSMLYCMGSMAILGSFEEGLGGYPTLLLTKSLMDGLMSIAMAASLGPGVILSCVPVFVYQASLTLAAGLLQPIMTPAATVEVAASGGLMLVAIGFNILQLTKIRVMDALPALIIAAVLAKYFL